MSKKPGSLLGGILLTGGSCIGAGMLGLPILTGLAGFFPSMVMFFSAWLFMTITGLLLVEVNGWFSHKANIVTMAGHTIGSVGRILSWSLYLFLFYALLVAYVSGSGSIFSGFLGISHWLASLFFTLLFGSLVFLGTRVVDYWNRILMVGMIFTYFALVFLGLKQIQPELLFASNPSLAFFSLPVLVASFGYHNMIPTLTSYMQGDLKRVRLTIIYGSVLALLIYLIWEMIVLGIVPMQGELGIIESFKQGEEGAQALSRVLGSSWVAIAAQGFAFFAILTSFLAQSLSLVHFLADGFKIKHEKQENIGICAAALLPPLFFSLIQPRLFLKALSFGGGIAALLFGVVPALMVWRGRYGMRLKGEYHLFGGKVLLSIIILFSLLIFVFQIANMVKAPWLPRP